MIEYIKGKLEELNPTVAVVETHGVGFELAISLNTYSALQGKSEVKLYVYEAIREDAHQLFGFSSKSERMWFLMLISVSGIGGQTARMILSAFTPSELSEIVVNEDVRSLKSVKGIGPKAAQRILVDLKDKAVLTAGEEGGTEIKRADGIPNKTVVDEAVSALAMLGFSPVAAQKVVVKISKEYPGYQVEMLIKEALKAL